MKKHGTRHEIRERLWAIRQMLGAGMEHRRIIAIGSEAWGIKPKQVRRYLDRVYVKWEEVVGDDEQLCVRDLAVEQRNEVFRQALARKRFGEALAALNSRDRIFGLHGDGPYHEGQRRRMTLGKLLEEVAETSGDIEESGPEVSLVKDCGRDRQAMGLRKRATSPFAGGD